MTWVTEYNTTTPDGKRVEYQWFKRVGDSRAESRDRVTVSGRVVHSGWVSDHRGYKEYKRRQSEG